MPPWFIGVMVGDVAGRIAFSRAVGLLLLWALPPMVVGNLAWQVMPLGPAKVVAWGTAIGMLAYALWRPTGSRLKLALLDGIYLWSRLAAVGCAVFLFLRFAFHDPSWGVLRDNPAPLTVFAGAIVLVSGLRAWVTADANRHAP